MSAKTRKVQVLQHPNGKSKNWYVRYWVLKPDGAGWREVWKSTRTNIKREAEEVRRRIERELDDGKKFDDRMTWDDFVMEHMVTHRPKMRPDTLTAYEMSFKAFGRYAKPRTLADIDIRMLERFVNARLKDEKRPAVPPTVNKDLRHVRAALNWAKRRGLINNPPSFKGIFLREDREKPIIIPEEDFLAMVVALTKPNLALIKRSGEWWRVWLYLAYYLGLRRGELFGLTWESIDLTTSEVLVRAGSSKGRKDRVIPVQQEIVQMLKAWKEDGEAGTVEVLPWPYDNYRPLYEDWHIIQTAAGIAEDDHYAPKNCRSSCASGLIAGGVPTIVVKDFLGHSSVTTTEKYYINTKPALRAAGSARKVVFPSESDSADSQTPS